MSKGLTALKRIRQETCPATYNPDFDKDECCNIIEAELKEKEEQEKKYIALQIEYVLLKKQYLELQESMLEYDLKTKMEIQDIFDILWQNNVNVRLLHQAFSEGLSYERMIDLDKGHHISSPHLTKEKCELLKKYIGGFYEKN